MAVERLGSRPGLNLNVHLEACALICSTLCMISGTATYMMLLLQITQHGIVRSALLLALLYAMTRYCLLVVFTVWTA